MGRKKIVFPEKKLHKQSQHYRLRLAGVEHWLGTDEAAAEQKRRKLLAESLLDAPPKSAPSVGTEWHTIAEALVRFEQQELPRYSAQQIWRFRFALDMLRELHGEEAIAEFDQLKLYDLRLHLLRQKVRKPVAPVDATPAKRKKYKYQTEEELPTLSRKYVNTLIGCIQTAWTWFVFRKLAPAGSDFALRAVRRLKKKQGGRELPRVKAAEPADVDKVLPELNHVVRAMVQVQRLTGMRPGELCQMRRCDMTLSPTEWIYPEDHPRVRAIKVKDTLIWLYAPASHKMEIKGKARVIAIGPQAQTILTPFLEGRAPDRYLFSPKEASHAWRLARGRKAVYGNGREPGDVYNPGSYAKLVRAACKRAGVKWFPNQLRHLVASESDEVSGRDTTQALLGHATPDMAAVYAEQSLGRAARHVADNG
jgi:integrase